MNVTSPDRGAFMTPDFKLWAVSLLLMHRPFFIKKLTMSKLKNIHLNLTSFQAFDLAQYHVNTLEYLQKMEIKNGGLTYQESRVKKTLTDIVHTIYSQLSKEDENTIFEIIQKEEREYNQTKNN